MDAQRFLDLCTADGPAVVFPDIQLDREIYLEVSKILQGASGKWSRKHKGFLFPFDAAPILAAIQTGQRPNWKKDFQFFPTPPKVVEMMAEFAFHFRDPDHQRILEPSAGMGHLIQAMPVEVRNRVDACEINPAFRAILEAQGIRLVAEDFLTYRPENLYDLVFANPPFNKGTDVEHVRHMYEVLAPGGRIVTVTGLSWTFNQQRKFKEFREWIESLDSEQICLESGEFRGSGTMVSSMILAIDKPTSETVPASVPRAPEYLWDLVETSS